MAKIKMTFSNFSDASLRVKASFIINNLTGNAHFPSPVPPLAEVQTALDVFADALANLNGSKEQTLIKNQAKETLQILLGELALNVQLISKGDELALETSGFDVITRRSSIGVLSKPVNFGAVPGDVPGSIKLSMKKIDGAKSYIFEYTTMPVTDISDWSSASTSRSSTTISDLTSGSQYCFKAVGVGADPTLVYSDEVSSFVL